MSCRVASCRIVSCRVVSCRVVYAVIVLASASGSCMKYRHSFRLLYEVLFQHQAVPAVIEHAVFSRRAKFSKLQSIIYNINLSLREAKVKVLVSGLGCCMNYLFQS